MSSVEDLKNIQAIKESEVSDVEFLEKIYRL